MRKISKEYPIFAVVTSIADAPEDNNIADFYRPRYAVNLRLLDEYLNIDEKQQEFEAVPVAISGGGMERGDSILPRPGTVVEIAYAYGKQSLMFVRSIMPYRLSLPNCTSDSVRIQQDWNSYLDIDRSGNNSRRTNANIKDTAAEQLTECINKLEIISNEISEIKGTSQKNIHGLFKRVAGAIKLLTAGSAHLGSAFNTNITAGQDINLAAGNNLFTKISKAILTISKETAKYIAPKNHIGSESENLFKLTSEFMEATIAALNILGCHTHPQVGKIDQGADVITQAEKIKTQKNRLDPIILQ